MQARQPAQPEPQPAPQPAMPALQTRLQSAQSVQPEPQPAMPALQTRLQSRNAPTGYPGQQQQSRNVPAGFQGYQGYPAQATEVHNIFKQPAPAPATSAFAAFASTSASDATSASVATTTSLPSPGKGSTKGSKSSKSGKHKGKNKSKSKKSGKGGKKSKSSKKGKGKKGNQVDFLRLVFEPEEFPVGVLTEISVTLSSMYYQTTACVDFYRLYRVDTELGDVLVTTLVRTRPGYYVFEGTFEVLSTFPGELYSFRAIPVIDRIEDPRSKLVVTALEALRSFAGGPTMPPATAAPTVTRTSTPTRAPVTAAPTVTRTSTPTRAPVTAPTRAPATAIPTGNPTRMPIEPNTPTRVPSDAPPVFEELLVIQGAPEAQFGRSIALSADGSILAVGAPFNSEFGSNAGRVGLYQLVGNTANILFDFSGAQVGLRVGQSMSMSRSSPPILAIGGTDFVDVYPISQFLDGGGSDPPVLEFDRFEADFIDEDYGTSIAMSGDGTRLAAGAPRAFIGSADVGMVQIYEIGGAQIGVEILGIDGNDFFGSAVTLSEDGTILASGALTGSFGAGYVKVFSQNGDNWDQVGQTIVGRESGDNLGKSVSMSADGQTVAIGAYQADAVTGAGYVQIFELVGTTWTQIGVDIVGLNDGDRFGFSVALTPDASVLIIGANANDSGGLTNNGLVQIYENQNGTWTQVGGDIAGNADSRNLGVAVAISSDGKAIAAGGPLSTAAQDTNVGEASVFLL
jgi:hypothetical protein